MTYNVTAQRLQEGVLRDGLWVSTICRSKDGYLVGTKDRFALDRRLYQTLTEPRLRALGTPVHRPVKSRPNDGPWLIPRSKCTEVADPLSDKTLHRKFSDLNTVKNIQRFASKWGWLGQFSMLKDRTDPALVVNGEPLISWVDEICVMMILTTLYDYANKGDEENLRRMISWTEKGVILKQTISRSHGQKEVELSSELHRQIVQKKVPHRLRRRTLTGSGHLIAGPTHNSHLLDRWKPGQDISKAAASFVVEQVNERLAHSVSPRISDVLGGDWHFEVRTTRTAIWLQFLKEIVGDSRTARCVVCNTWMTPQRTTMKTCSEKCRKARSRSTMRAAN